MPDLIFPAYEQFLETSPWELLAVLLAIAYLLLALRENSLCWYCALASTAIYTVLFWDVSLLMESGLNAYYMVMAVYGWYYWRRGDGQDKQQSGAADIRSWRLSTHMLAWGLIALLSIISGYLLASNTSAVLPYLDSFTTWGSVLTTWMVARKILENWLYWIVIDGVSIVLYLDRGLYLTSLLFGAYVIIVIFGYLSWRKRMAMQNSMEIENVLV
ncbi:MAG: nicotinamide mononucleotide transporter [Cellvibrionales bacterium]|nr:MAG: nicotinamide mononucleotide transporter [Cellvibrionales bacterium]